MKFFITGGAGFIGSHFADRVLKEGHEAIVFDDLSTGSMEFLKGASKSSKFRFIKGDIREFEQVKSAMGDTKPDWLIHFAANADVRRGLERPRRDLDYNTTGTWNCVEAARLSGCKRVVFSSTGSVYGEPEIFPTPETAPFPIQTSLYAASKLAGEGILSAYSFGYDMSAIVFRFVSIMGPRYTHGHVFDFIKALKSDSSQLKVLGDGNQTKSYLHIEDLMDGLWKMVQKDPKGFHIFNIGHDDALTVKLSISYILNRMNLKPQLNFTGGTRGWVGDSPRIQLDTTKLKKEGWATKHSLKKAVEDTVDYLLENSFLLERE